MSFFIFQPGKIATGPDLQRPKNQRIFFPIPHRFPTLLSAADHYHRHTRSAGFFQDSGDHFPAQALGVERSLAAQQVPPELRADNRVLGAIGISGDTGDNDEIIAVAGIEAAGLKGRRVGEAQVSLKHANFILNQGRATAAQVKALISEIQEQVWRRQGVALEREVIFLPDDLLE